MRFLPAILAACAVPLLLGNGAGTGGAGIASKNTDPALIPPAIKSMLDAAIASGNEVDINTIVKYATNASPDNADAIRKIALDWKNDRDQTKTEHIQQAGFLDLWSGKAELGAFLTTGNSNTSGVSASLNLLRDGLAWRQKIKAQVDYQRSLGVTTREHYLVAYEPNYKLTDRSYIYGSAQYESDRFLGYTERYSTSVGAGFSVIKTSRAKLDLEIGPGFRATSFTDHTNQASIAARGSLDFSIQLPHGVRLTQSASGYLERYNSTLTGTTALNAKLFGPLAAQLSYNVQYESQPPVGNVSTDTITRAGLSYSF